jgi:hypothetical protein
VEFAERAARNEEIFREINEKIEAGAERHGVSSPLPFHCECAAASCTETIELDPASYERIAANPLHFVVKPDHRVEGVETVIAEHGDYVVVEKTGKARAEIEQEHPRPRHHRND